MEKKYTWEKIAESVEALEFASNNIAVAEVKGKKICIGKFRDELFAFAHECPHAGGIMARGYIDGMGQVVCPVHEMKFSLKTGMNGSGEDYRLRHWPVETRETGVFVGLEEKPGNWNVFR